MPTRSGMVYQQGTNYLAVLQIDPVVPCDVLFNLTAPDGSKRTAQGKGDRFGYFTSEEKWRLDQPGFGLTPLTPPGMVSKARFQDFRTRVGTSFVLENASQSGPGIALNLFEQQTFSPENGLEIQGNSSASEVYFAAITPGAVLEEGVIPVVNGQFSYKFDPKKLADR